MKGKKELSAALIFLAAGCGGYDNGASVEVSFARRQQAQVSEEGLPADLGSLRVEARQGGIDGTLLDDSGCLVLGAGDSRRASLTLDLTAGTGRAILVKGWSQSGCPGTDPEWMGVALDVDVPSGKRLSVPVFVTRRGLRLNLARDELSPSRAFASATALADGRVLIAGGFDVLYADAQTATLTATNRALIYDPTTGKTSITGGLSESRGAHRAILLSDGRVLLVGGAKRATVHHQEGSLFLVLQEDPLWTADIYDPAQGQFQQAGQQQLLARTEPALALGPDGTVYLLGGKTSLARTDEIVTGRENGSTWQWSLAQKRLVAARRDARAAVLGSMLLVTGGDGAGDVPAEAAELSDLEFQAVPGFDAHSGLELVGHSLSVESPERVVLAGGISPNGVQQPSSAWMAFWVTDGTVNVFEGALLGARAYHAAAILEPGLVLAGGVGAGFALRQNLELAVSLEEPERVLDDSLTCASIGIAAAQLPDGSLLLSGGLGRGNDSAFRLCSELEILSP